MDTISLYEAITQMRKLSQKEKSFSFTHATYSSDKKSGDGIRTVRSARLRPAAKGDDITKANYKLFYFDEDLNLPRNCWQILIMYFNGKKVVID